MSREFHKKSILYPITMMLAMCCDAKAMVNGYQHVPQNVIQDAIQNSRLNQSVASISGNSDLLNRTTNNNSSFNSLGQVYGRHLSPTEQQTKQSETIGVSKRTCLEALQLSVEKGICKNYCILDLSNTVDFAQNADLATQQFFTRVQSAGVKYIYMDLYNSSVNDAYISKWNTQFKQSGIHVLWNLSGNETVTDQTITILGNLDNIVGLNIAGTLVSDLGATQLVTMLSGSNPIELDFINIYGSKISNNGYAMLETKFLENVNKWNALYPDKKTSGRGIINDMGLNFDKKLIGGDVKSINNTMGNQSIRMGTMLPTQSVENTLINSSQSSLSQNVDSTITPVTGNSNASIQTTATTGNVNLVTGNPILTSISNAIPNTQSSAMTPMP